jgi:hypothetical protein
MSGGSGKVRRQRHLEMVAFEEGEVGASGRVRTPSTGENRQSGRAGFFRSDLNGRERDAKRREIQGNFTRGP